MARIGEGQDQVYGKCPGIMNEDDERSLAYAGGLLSRYDKNIDKPLVALRQ